MVIKTVKKEIRVLGLTKIRLDNRVDVIGVVYRGGFLMDGLLYFKAEHVEAHGLPKLIKESRHYKQLRVLVCRSEDGFDCETLWMETGILVICLDPDGGFRHYGVDRNIAIEILRKTSRIGCEPEALRNALKLKKALEERFKSML